MRLGALAAIMLAIAALAGCGGSATLYDLSTASPSIKPLRGAVRVRTPMTNRSLEGDWLLERLSGARVEALPNVKWRDILPHLIAARVTQSLQKAHIRAYSESGPTDVDYDLHLAIDDFSLDVEASKVRVVVRVELVALQTGRTVATRKFSAGASAAAAGAAEALDQAFQTILVEIVGFVGAAAR